MQRATIPAFVSCAYLAAATVAPGGADAASKAQVITCRGSEQVCKASVSLAGGASNKLIKVALPGTSWRRPSVGVTPASSRGAYSISRAQFFLGGSEYRFTLNAVRANPRGSHLTLTFRKR
jgi:hypothetical protein